MKKRLTVIFILVACVLCLGANFAQLDTSHRSILLLRTEADEDSDALDLTTEGDFANKPSSAVQLPVMDDGTGHGGNTVEIFFAGGSAANKTFTYKVYGWRRTNGMARMIATGTGTLGTQAVVKYPDSGSTATSKFWADTLSVTGRWLKTVSSSDETGNNEVATLQFDFCGYEWLWVEITDADGSTGDEAGDVSVYYSFF